MDAAGRSPAVDPEQLLAQAQWVRALVRRLIADEDAVEDVLQDTWAAALARGPRRGLRAWLGVVARNLALRRRRREWARAAVERGAARREAQPGPAEEVERMQLQRHLADAVLALQEPCRSAVIQRHLDGRSYADIARRQGCSEAAARQRVSRGVAQLRARLDRDLGGRGAWCALLAGAWRLAEPASAAPWMAGGIAVGAKGWIAAGALAASAALAGGVAWKQGQEARPAPAAALAAAAPQAPLRAPEPLELAAPGGASRTAFAAPPPSAPAKPPAHAAAPEAKEQVRWASLRGRVLKPDGLPAPPPGEVLVEVLDREGRRAVASGSMDSGGTYFVSGVAPGTLVRVTARAKGFGPGVALPNAPIAPDEVRDLDVTLTAGALVQGVVVDAVTRAPVAGAQVWAESYMGPDDEKPAGESDALGRFELRGVAMELHESDEGGRFALVRLQARAPGYANAPLRMVMAPASPRETYFFELELQPALCVLRGRVLAPGGVEPVTAGAMVLVLDPNGNMRFAGLDRDGRFELGDLPPGELSAVVAVDQDAPAPLGGARLERTVTLAPGEAAELELVLEDPGDGRVAGSVRDLAGRPVEGAELRLSFRYEGGGLAFGMRREKARSDAQGRFTFEPLPSGLYALSLDDLGGNAARPLERVVRLERDQRLEDLDFELAPAVEVSGWVDAGEVPLEELELHVLVPGGDERLADQRPGAGGTFRIGGLFPQPMELVLLRAGRELQRLPVGPAGATGLTLTAR